VIGMVLFFKWFGWILLVVLLTLAHYMIYGVILSPFATVSLHLLTSSKKMHERTAFRLSFAIVCFVLLVAFIGAVLAGTGLFRIIPYPNPPA
jgi:hypothetical protein